MLSRLASLAIVGVLLVSGSACSGDEKGGSDDVTPEEAMSTAKTKLDETSGVAITIKTDDLPEEATGILAAEGTGTHAPAFEGSLTVQIPGGKPVVPVIAVDDTVYAILPFTSDYQDVNPTEYGAPDPASLMTPDQGFSALLAKTTDLEKGEEARGGDNNKEIFTEYTGTVPGSTVKGIIPGSTGDFEATYTISDSGELRTAVLTGEFYEGEDAMTYTIGFDDYGTEKDITAP